MLHELISRNLKLQHHKGVTFFYYARKRQVKRRIGAQKTAAGLYHSLINFTFKFNKCDNYADRVAKNYIWQANLPLQFRKFKRRAVSKMTLMFRHIFSSFRQRLMHSQAVQDRLPLQSIKQSLETLLNDCETKSAQRMVNRIKLARTPGDLWDLRCEIHQCISHVHSQTEASRRINSLVTVFTGWVPTNKLTKI